MQIVKLEIKNFRALESVDIRLNKCSVLIGENDVGKTSVLTALDRFFECKKISDPDDFFRRDTSKAIELTVDLSIADGEDSLKPYLRDDGCVRAKRTFTFEKAPDTFLIKVDHTAVKCPKDIAERWLSSDNFHFVPVRRDLAVQFSMTKTALLGKMIRNAMRERLKGADASQSLDTLKTALKGAIEPSRLALEQLVREQLHNQALEVLFAEMEIDPLEGVGFSVRIKDDKKMETPMEYRGAGTQNNLIIALFRLIAKMELRPDFIIAMEEPENSLHPKAQRQLFAVLQEIGAKNQTIVTTHSPVFIDRAHFESNIFLTRTPAGNTTAKTFNKDMLAEIRGEMDIRVSDALLKGGGNCALLVEGSTEEDGFPVLMEMMGLSEFQLGLSIIKMEGSDCQKARTIIRLLGAYEIPCVVVLDRDAKETAEDLVRGIKSELSNLRNVYLLKKGTIEDYYPLEVVAEVITRECSPTKPVTADMFDASASGEARLHNIKKIMYETTGNSNLEYFKKSLGRVGTGLLRSKNLPIEDELQEIFRRVAEIANGK